MMNRRERRSTPEESGTTVVEGALVFGIFMTLVLAIVEFGNFFLFWSTGRNAASEGGHDLAIAGSAVGADYEAMRQVKSRLNRLGNNVDYVIVYRAKNVNEKVPLECIAQAEANRTVSDPNPQLLPTGYFRAGASTDPNTFNWLGNVRPDVACNVYYPRNLSLIPGHKEAFTHNPSTTATTPSLDKFWPGNYRTDWISGPVDYGAVYIQTRYDSLTGIIPTRKVAHRAVVQIEPKKSTR
jgi:Flp pilus assembly protein TadG